MTWISDASVVSGLSTSLTKNNAAIFNDSGTWKAIFGNNAGTFTGWYWSGSTWVSDSSIITGLIDKGSDSSISIFDDSGTWKAITGSTPGYFYGWYWNGSTWIEDSSIVNGISTTYYSIHGALTTSSVFNDSGTLKIIIGIRWGTFFGHYWNGSTWVSDSSIVSGLTDVGIYSAPTVFDDSGTWKLISGRDPGTFVGWYWNGSTWVSDSSIIDGLGDIGDHSLPCVYNDGGLKLISGELTSQFNGFITQEPYIISGIVSKSDGSPNVGITVRVTNITNDEYADDTSDSGGNYSIDLNDLTTSPLNGDIITVRCYSIYKTTTVDTINFSSGRTVNLTCFSRFQIDNVDITGIISNKVSKTIGQAAWNSETLLENKNGYRSTNYQSFQPLQIDIDGVTLLKGRIRDVDLNTNHLLKISGENYSSLLNDAYITDQQSAGSTFNNKSIYYAITDSSDGIIPNYASSVTTTNVVNDANTQQTFTKTFNKESISSALMWLGELASSIGYIFYVDNNKDLHFEERRTIDTELTLVNTGSRKCVMGWEWRNSSGKDIYNRIRVIGSGVDVTRNDISSQTEFGIREHPTITDNNITIVADANTVGDNLLSRYANPFKEVVLKCKTNADVADSIFPLLFTSYFGGYKGLLYLEPGDLIRTDISGIGIPQSNIFPWTFSTDFTPEKRIVLSIEHQFPQYITTLKLSEYYKDLSTLIASNVKGEIK